MNVDPAGRPWILTSWEQDCGGHYELRSAATITVSTSASAARQLEDTVEKKTAGKNQKRRTKESEKQYTVSHDGVQDEKKAGMSPEMEEW